MRAITFTIAAAFLTVAGCERKEVTLTAPLPVKAALPFPSQFDGAWVMSAGWHGYMGVALALSGDRYYYWKYSDVASEANFPYTGTFRIEGDELILGQPSELATGNPAAHLYSDRWLILRRPLSVQLQAANDQPDDHRSTLLPDFQFDPSSPFRNQPDLKPEPARASGKQQPSH